MTSITEDPADIIQLGVDDGNIFRLTFQGNQAILDLPDIRLSNNVCDKIIAELEKLIQEESAPRTRSLSENVKYVLDNRNYSPVLPSDVEVLTRVNDRVISLTICDLTGDIRFHSTGNLSPRDHEFNSKLHQATMRLVMKKWRDKITQTREIISNIISTINKLQAYSSIIGSLSFISGIITDTPSYLVLSFITFLVTGVLALVKRTI
jgi:hypothetical protein